MNVNATLKNSLRTLQILLCERPFVIPCGGAPAEDGSRTLLDVLQQNEIGGISAGGETGGGDTLHLPDSLVEALSQAQSIASAPLCPIVAVLGMLNAGKSSLVATFLGSSSGLDHRRRVLIGSANNEGTHRFVLWLPDSWRSQGDLWGFVVGQLESVFGSRCEMLDEDPIQAAKQYNDLSPRSVLDTNGKPTMMQPIRIPLIATDPHLDRLGIALMDCPDVQTGLVAASATSTPLTRYEEHTARAAEARFEVLSKAATICSAFLVVLPAHALHDQTVSRLLKLLERRMPHVQRMLAVNRVPRRYSTASIAREVDQLYRASNIRRVYMAYNFDGPQARERLPSPPGEIQLEEGEHTLPLFFRIDRPPIPQPPDAIPDSNWLIRLGGQLQSTDLLEDAIRSATTHLITTVHRALTVATRHIDQLGQQARYLQQVIADACADFSRDPSSGAQGGLRLQASRQIIQQIAESLERTAPWWARPGRWMQRIAQAGKSSVAGAVSWMRLPGWVSDGGNAVGEWVRYRFKRGETGQVVTADSLCDHLARRDVMGLLGLDEEPVCRGVVRDACQRAIERFQAESSARLDPEHIDALTSRIWSEMPVRQRILSGVAPAGILFAPLLAVIMIPLDFGGTSVLVFASLKELLFAGAAGFGLMLASADSVPALAESESAWQQLSDLVGVLTDELGLERAGMRSPLSVQVGNGSRELTASPVSVRRSNRSDAPGSRWRSMEIEPMNVQAIHQTLDAIERVYRT
jgi:hypothetical protein